MTKREEEVLKLIKENPMISQKECAAMLGITRSAIAGHIMNLTAKGFIEGKGYILREEPYALVIGGSNMDILGKPESIYVERDSNPGSVELSPGGVGRNIAENLARLGTSVKMLTVLGDDIYGKQLLETCRDAGIDMNHVKISGNKGTSVYLSILDENGDMISAVSDMSVMEELDTAYLEKHHRIISAASLLILDANLSEEVLKHLTEKYVDKDIFVDTVSSSKAKKLRPLLNRINTIKPNRIEAEILTGLDITDKEKLELAADLLLKEGVKRIFLSLGTEGIYYCDKERSLTFKGEQVEAVNTTGAGDAYTAALAYSYLNCFTPEKTLAFAAAASKLTVQCRETINRNISSDLIEKMIKGEYL